jgi:hypothetical protein
MGTPRSHKRNQPSFPLSAARLLIYFMPGNREQECRRAYRAVNWDGKLTAVGCERLASVVASGLAVATLRADSPAPSKQVARVVKD